jgi:hypothetical protein
VNLKEIFEQARHVALYQDPKYGSVYVGTYFGEKDPQYHSGDIRLSAPLEVRFNSLPNDEMVQGAVKALDEAATQVRLEMQRQLDEIAERKSQLLSITFQPDESQCSCLCPMDKSPGHHHSLACALHVEVVS